MDQSFKIVLVGSAGVGKTTFLEMINSRTFNNKYVSTIGVDVVSVSFNSNVGKITFEVWDTAGQEKLMGLGDGYYVNAHGAIIMFDVTNVLSYNDISSFKTRIKNVIGDNAPIVVVANKCENPRKVKYSKQVVMETSVKFSHGIIEPFQKLACILTGNNDLIFIF